MRLFVSVDLPDDLADAVAAVQDEFADASGLEFTDPTQAHLTLKFLGDVPDGDVPEIEAALERAVDAADVAPFEATFAGLGVFPSEEYIRVLWLGVEDGAEELTRLQAAVESAMVDLGFDEEDHEFTPHVTLARMKHAGGKELVQAGVRERDPTVGTATVESVHLTRSDLTPEGPEYTTVHTVPVSARDR
ncbi:RNA 2',3'-cyclic phosphodiesterase [Halobacteriaceae archaeon GCM10025711]